MWGYKNKSYLDQTKVINGLGTLIVGKDGRNVIQTYYQPSNSYYLKVEISDNGGYGTDLVFGTKNVTFVNPNDINLFVYKNVNDYHTNNVMIVPPYSSYRATFPIKNSIWYDMPDVGNPVNIYLEMEV